jgi:hypothetical protein
MCYLIFFLTAQQVEALQTEQNSLNNTITNNTELLYNMNQRSKDLMDEGNYEQTLQILNETLSIDPNFIDTLTNMHSQ